MRTIRSALLPSLAAILAGTVASGARAQVDVEPPMPNVMIMADTSGSMLRRFDGSLDTTCAGLPPADLNEIRWFALVQALTGNIADLKCSNVPRTDAAFPLKFGPGAADASYYIPYFQILDDDCGLYPNPALFPAPPGNWYTYPTDPLLPRTPGGAVCDFDQAPGGIIDAYKRQVRFGLMTFDSLVDPSVGVAGVSGNNATVNSVTGQRGQWSYWYESNTNNWLAGGRGLKGIGMPAACPTPGDVEVGARGPAAPPWEGRMMGFGYDRARSGDVAEANERIEQIITASRPYGATPLAGMMSDFYQLVLGEQAYIPDPVDPVNNPRRPLGASNNGGVNSLDTLWQEGAGCRPFHVIVISDGEPNLDLRPDCGLNDAGGNGRCPFPPIVTSTGVYNGDKGPTDAANHGILADGVVNRLNGTNRVIFHVIGIGVNSFVDPQNPSGPPATCNDTRYHAPGGSRCGDGLTPPRSQDERTCCILNSIQYEGHGRATGQEVAAYAQNSTQLRKALDDLLANIATGTATRTTSVFQATTPTLKTNDPDVLAAGHEVRAALETVVGDGMWSGRLERGRYRCMQATPTDPLLPVLQNPLETLGDDFASNIRKEVEQRTMYTVVKDGTPEDSWKSLRPRLTVNDGVGLSDVDQVVYVNDAEDWAEDNNLVQALALDANECEISTGTNDLDACSERILKWYTGQDSGTTLLPVRKNPLGAIYHSQPIIVGPPREFVRDEAYDIFATQQRRRPTVVYASSVDGQLHAFMLANNGDPLDTDLFVDQGAASFDGSGNPINTGADDVNNELWSFVPPIVLSNLRKNPNRHALFLDGGINVRNMPEARLPDEAAATGSFTDSRYRTYLVASSGRAEQIDGNGYYFALDVTDPHPESNDFTDTVEVPGNTRFEAPKFLWQLSRTDAAATAKIATGQLFGASVPEAALTTISYLDPNDSELKEIPVAILAGGITGSPSGAPVSNSYVSGSIDGTRIYEGTVTPRGTSRNWPGSARPDRSITIVRVDTGEIIMRWRGPPETAASTTFGLASTRIRDAGFMAPMSGTPVPYPGLTGQVSTRVFIGDADGVLWAVNLANPNPANWRVQIAYDAYHGLTPADSAPIETLPVVSVDTSGNPVVIFSTGAQDDFYVNTGKNFVTSITGVPGATQAVYRRNWELDLQSGFAPVNGQRVTGPINLFNSVVYFATFVPSGNACTLGESRIFGLHYTNSVSNAGLVPVAGTDLDRSDPTNHTIDLLADRFRSQTGTIFGVAIGQVPTCLPPTTTPESDDVFGGYQSFESTAPASFQLVVLQGRDAPGVPALNSGTVPGDDIMRVEIPLDSPRPTTRIDSWAAIVE